ncbi:hypothetical protein BC628DRAFT_146795 [Trametes gibbosa]|nr:hypothetical protein BC628DRAFT_146795 [Trametes gibbosa]
MHIGRARSAGRGAATRPALDVPDGRFGGPGHPPQAHRRRLARWRPTSARTLFRGTGPRTQSCRHELISRHDTPCDTSRWLLLACGLCGLRFAPKRRPCSGEVLVTPALCSVWVGRHDVRGVFLRANPRLGPRRARHAAQLFVSGDKDKDRASKIRPLSAQRVCKGWETQKICTVVEIAFAQMTPLRGLSSCTASARRLTLTSSSASNSAQNAERFAEGRMDLAEYGARKAKERGRAGAQIIPPKRGCCMRSSSAACGPVRGS